MSALATAPAPLQVADLLGAFKPGRAVRPKVEAIPAGLVRMGHVSRTGAGYGFRRGV